jgi:DNA-binding CsgD family transcriptional regulator
VEYIRCRARLCGGDGAVDVSLHRLVETYVDKVQRCETMAELFALTEAAAREIGFAKLAIVHGLAFRCPERRLIRADNFGEWAEIFVTRHYYRDDPALLASQRTNTAFAWCELPALVPLTPQRMAILAEAGRHGLRSGFTLPVGVTGEPAGCCSFASAGRRLPSRWQCRAAALIGAEAFREARRLHGFPARARTLPRLSRRKLECLHYLSLGKTDGEIGIILGLSEATIRTYMRMLRADFDVVSRTQLVAHALRFGLIGFDDAIPSP